MGSPAQQAQLQSTCLARVWKPEHDWALVKGTLEHGWVGFRVIGGVKLAVCWVDGVGRGRVGWLRVGWGGVGWALGGSITYSVLPSGH